MHTMTLIDDRAISLLNGREHGDKPGITGFFRWASVMSTVWKDAEANNAWAIAYLARNSYFIRRCTKLFTDYKTEQEAAQPLLNDIIAVVGEKEPPSQKTFTLRFSNPYAYHVAKLIEQFDCLIYQYRQLWDLGVISTKNYKKQTGIAGRHIRAIFHCVSDYRTGLDEPALCESVMGKLSDVFTGEAEPLYLPPPLVKIA